MILRQLLKAEHTQAPRVITQDNNADPAAMATLQQQTLPEKTQLSQSKYLFNYIEQAHTNIKPIVNPMMRFKSFNSARRTLSRIEAINMLKKGQVKGIKQGDSVSGVKLIELLFGLAASTNVNDLHHLSLKYLCDTTLSNRSDVSSCSCSMRHPLLRVK